MLLAIETSTNICSVSFQDKTGEIHQKRTERKGSHSELLFIFVRALMEEHEFSMADLDAVLVSNGPGSYTGLRIAASAVKGFLFGLEVPVYAANTLAAFAMGVCDLAEPSTQNIHAVINARRSHLYHQKFSFGQSLKAESEATILELEEIEQLIEKGDRVVGTGIDRLKAEILDKTENIGTERVSANSIIKLFNADIDADFFEQTTAEELESNYISSSQVNNTKVS